MTLTLKFLRQKSSQKGFYLNKRFIPKKIHDLTYLLIIIAPFGHKISTFKYSKIMEKKGKHMT
jgi:hypothetical protein